MPDHDLLCTINVNGSHIQKLCDGANEKCCPEKWCCPAEGMNWWGWCLVVLALSVSITLLIMFIRSVSKTMPAKNKITRQRLQSITGPNRIFPEENLTTRNGALIDGYSSSYHANIMEKKRQSQIIEVNDLGQRFSLEDIEERPLPQLNIAQFTLEKPSPKKRVHYDLRMSNVENNN